MDRTPLSQELNRNLALEKSNTDSGKIEGVEVLHDQKVTPLPIAAVTPVSAEASLEQAPVDPAGSYPVACKAVSRGAQPYYSGRDFIFYWLNFYYFKYFFPFYKFVLFLIKKCKEYQVFLALKLFVTSLLLYLMLSDPEFLSLMWAILSLLFNHFFKE
jgi:hypothetical protein